MSNDPQIRVTATVKDNSKGGELLVFTIPLGFFQLICIVNIPQEGENTSAVYVKFKVNQVQQIPESYTGM